MQKGKQNEMVLVFLLVVVVDGVTHLPQRPIYFNSIVTCGEYSRWIEETGTTWQTSRGEKQSQIQAHCLPEIVNPAEVQVWK